METQANGAFAKHEPYPVRSDGKYVVLMIPLA